MFDRVLKKNASEKAIYHYHNQRITVVSSASTFNLQICIASIAALVELQFCNVIICVFILQ